MAGTEFRIQCNCSHERRVTLTGSDRYDLDERLEVFQQLPCATCDDESALQDFASYRDLSGLEPLIGGKRDQIWGERIRTRVIGALPLALVTMRRMGLDGVETQGFTTDLGVWGLLELEAALHWRAEEIRAERDALWWIHRRADSHASIIAPSPYALLKEWRRVWESHLSASRGVLVG